MEKNFVQATIPEIVLDVGAHDAGGVLRAEGEGLALVALGAAAILPGKHFFGDDIGLFAYSAGEEFGGLEDGRADFVEVVGAEDVAHGGFDEVPERGVGREKVAGSAGRFDHVRYSLVVVRCSLGSYRHSISVSMCFISVTSNCV